MEKAKLSLEKTEYTSRTNVDKAEVALERARVSLEKAEDELDIARDELDKTVIMAPFAGFITMVNVEGGDEVTKGTVAVSVADPDKFEAEIYVGELDIDDVEIGGIASVKVDALDVTVPAEVTHISPTATIQSGVVNYTVRVALQSLETMLQQQQAAIPDTTSEEMPDFMQQAIHTGDVHDGWHHDDVLDVHVRADVSRGDGGEHQLGHTYGKSPHRRGADCRARAAAHPDDSVQFAVAM